MKHIKTLAIFVVIWAFVVGCAAFNVSKDVPTDEPAETPISTATTLIAIPQATSTSAPQPDWIVNFTEPILKAIADRLPTYQDDFDNPSSGWHNGPTTEHPNVKIDGEKRYDNGEYFIALNGITSAEPVICSGVEDRHVGSYSDFVAEFDVRYVSGIEGDWHLQFHRSPSGLYKFGLTRSGYVNFGKCGFGLDECLGLADYSGSPIHRGEEWNHIQLIVQGTRMAAYVNSMPVLYAEDALAVPEHTKGYFSLNLCNFGSAPLETRWDNFKLWDVSDLP